MSRVVPLREAGDPAHVGGKAANLGRLIRAGLAVPDGFVILPGHHDADQDVLDAYAQLGGGTVAVRSSATAEDGATASMAGQYETVLNVVGDAALLAAVCRCRASAASDRVRTYLDEHGLAAAGVAMAVIVQRQVTADAAGVLFTAAPGEAFPRRMLIEAGWGLGESVVSGRVSPDVLSIDFEDGRVHTATIADKAMELTRDGEQCVDDTRRRRSCLTSNDVHRLWQIGRQIESHFGRPQDIEWAMAEGQLYLLQSRPITTAGDVDAVVRVVSHTRTWLSSALSGGRGPWVLHSLSETLPHPTPLTWSVIERFMAASGGYGRAYAALGFAPHGDCLDRIAGRIYLDAGRAPNMFAADFGFAYDVEALRRHPEAAQQPPTRPTGRPLRRLRAARMQRVAERRLRWLAAADARRDDRSPVLADKLAGRVLQFRRDVPSRGLGDWLRISAFAPMREYISFQSAVRLEGLSPAQLAETWDRHETAVMSDFGACEVLAGLVAGWSLQSLTTFLAEQVWDEDPAAVARVLTSAGADDVAVAADRVLNDVNAGRASLDEWLALAGHRGVGELELAAPRWRDVPDAVRAAAARLAAAPPPDDRIRRQVERVGSKHAALRQSLSTADAAELDRRVALARRAIVDREAAKDWFIRGYGLLRDAAKEIGVRLGIGDGVFYLSRDEILEALSTGYAPVQRIDERRQAHTAEARLAAPPFIDAAVAATFGERTAAASAAQAVAISAGVATGPALVVQSPDDVGATPSGYVLICPSTDPAWTALFAHASALVVERGGTLSHGAIVAREMGLPAVVLPDATRRFKSGQIVRVDGDRGTAAVAGDEPLATAAVTADETFIEPTSTPPPPGQQDRRAARVRNFAAAGWALFLAAFFMLPDPWLRWPVFAAFDAAVWPLARAAGWPWTVAGLAVCSAGITLLVQRQCTDRIRLLAAKRRAARLRREADAWPAGSPRRAALRRAGAGVAWRLLGASLVPVGVLLGPMVAGFIWLGQRADPAARNAVAGSAVRVVARIDGEWTGAIRMRTPADITIDESTPPEQALPPLRRTLERLLTLYRQPGTADKPWELAVAPDPSRRAAADDLRAYLDAGLPPQALTWLLRPPASFDGTFDVGVACGNTEQRIGITLGTSRPPRPMHAAGPVDSPIRSLEVVYARPVSSRPFLPVGGVDVGWVGEYVGVYAATLLIGRRLAGVA